MAFVFSNCEKQKLAGNGHVYVKNCYTAIGLILMETFHLQLVWLQMLPL